MKRSRGRLTKCEGIFVLSVMLLPGAATAQSAPQPPAACERLASLSLPNTAFTLAEVVNAGAFAPEGRGRSMSDGSAMRERITAVSRSTRRFRAKIAAERRCDDATFRASHW